MSDKEFGIIIDLKNDKLTVQTNNGIKLSYRKKDHNISRYSRVSITLDDNYKIVGIKKLSDQKVKGNIVLIYPDDSGLIQTQYGEVLFFRNEDLKTIGYVPELGHNVICNAVAPCTGQHKFASAKDIEYVPVKKIDENLLETTSKLLINSLGTGETTAENIIQLFADNGIVAEEYGFTDRFIFLEQFSNVLRVNYERNSVEIFDSSKTEEYYQESLKLINNIGYDKLTKLQENAVRDKNFWESNRILIMGTTSSGKTMIPLIKYMYEKTVLKRDVKMLIAVPYRALAAQMYNSLKEKFSSFNLDIAYSTSEKIDQDEEICRADVDVAIIIYEKLFIFQSDGKNILKKYDYLVLDEIGIIQDKERGIKAELTEIHAEHKDNLNIIMLATPYFNWSSFVQQYRFYPVKSFSRPVNVREYFFEPYKVYNKILGKEHSKYFMYDSFGKQVPIGKTGTFKNMFEFLCQNEYNLGHKVIVFCFSKRVARDRATNIYKLLKKQFQWEEPTIEEREQFKQKLIKKYNLTIEELKGVFDQDIEFDALYHGITFHCASFPEAMRIAIETEFLEEPSVIKDGVKIVVATETLAFGLNSNVDTIIMNHMKKAQLGGSEQCIDNNLYQNCIGRAGRLGYRSSGTSYTFIPEEIATDNQYSSEAAKKYSSKAIKSSPELVSRLSNILNSNDWKNIVFAVLNFFTLNTSISLTHLENILLDHLGNKIENKEQFGEMVKKAVDFLNNEKFICISDEPDDFDDDDELYILTNKGKLLKSYLISSDSYRIIESSLDIFKEKNVNVFDYLFRLSDCSEVSNFCSNIILRFKYGDEKHNENVCSDLDAFVNLLESELPEIYRKGYISDKFYKEIIELDDYIYLKAQLDDYYNYKMDSDEINISEDMYMWIIKIKVALYLTLRISGYSLGLINDISGWSNGAIDNIKSKFGEKMSYLADISASLASLDAEAEHASLLLRQVSLSLFYGIRLDWVRKHDFVELDSEKARIYSVASMYSVRKEYLRQKADTEEYNEFMNEYNSLEKKVRQLIEKEEE